MRPSNVGIPQLLILAQFNSQCRHTYSSNLLISISLPQREHSFRLFTLPLFVNSFTNKKTLPCFHRGAPIPYLLRFRECPQCRRSHLPHRSNPQSPSPGRWEALWVPFSPSVRVSTQVPIWDRRRSTRHHRPHPG